jgi:hypothetical protein
LFEPFPDKLATYRVIEIPPALGEEARSRFVQAVQTRTQQQAQLAQQCDAVLAVAGDVQKEPTRLIVSHEPAASANLSTILSAGAKPDIETLWWVTWNLVRALRAGQAVGFMHGGIQSASVLRDEQGRIKLADFGLAPAFESVCGRGCRRYVVCSPMVASEAGPGEPSGRWALLSECETGRFDWIACHFAPELLGWENLPLGAGADSFALGVLLFLWATGLHPYNSELPEPTLTCYFRVEPLAFEDENVRPDWKAALKCARDRLATREDRTVITWTGLVRDLLEDNEAKRLVSWGEAEHRILEFIPPAWPHTLHVLRAPGDPETLLREVVPLAEQEALPPLCHVSLVRWLEQQRREAEKRRVDREAQEVLGAARDDIEHFAFDRAREHLELLLRDPMLPAPYRGQAQRLLDEAVRGEGQAAELRGAASDYSEGRLPEALDRLKALLANDSVLVLVSSQARLLADEIEVERREIDECRGTL